jgi:hypothetical protein
MKLDLQGEGLAVSVFDFEANKGDIIIEGSLIKKNWYSKLQLRHF